MNKLFMKDNYLVIENDMNQRNSTSKKRSSLDTIIDKENGKTRKKRIYFMLFIRNITRM